MTKYMIPHTIEAHSAAVVSLRGEVAQLAFFEGGQDVHYVLLSRSVLADLGRDIVEELKAKQPPFRHQ